MTTQRGREYIHARVKVLQTEMIESRTKKKNDDTVQVAAGERLSLRPEYIRGGDSSYAHGEHFMSRTAGRQEFRKAASMEEAAAQHVKH